MLSIRFFFLHTHSDLNFKKICTNVYKNSVQDFIKIIVQIKYIKKP